MYKSAQKVYFQLKSHADDERLHITDVISDTECSSAAGYRQSQTEQQSLHSDTLSVVRRGGVTGAHRTLCRFCCVQSDLLWR